MQLVRVVEGMPSLMPQIHHDLSRAFKVIVLLFNLRHIGPRQIKRNSNHRLSRGASPFVCQITTGMKLEDFFLFQLAIELLHKFFKRRSLDR